jgi:hypothetical protein
VANAKTSCEVRRGRGIFEADWNSRKTNAEVVSSIDGSSVAR